MRHSPLPQLLVAAALFFAGAHCMQTKIDAATTFCVTEPVARDIEMTFQFTVTAGGKHDLDVSIFDGTGRLLQGWKAATSGEHKVKGDPQNKQFRICFDNTMARFTPKWVEFYFHHGQHPSAVKVESLDPIERNIENLKNSIDELNIVQQRLRQSEKNHRATVEDANERVLLWSVFETIALFGMGIFQIFFLKRFLERKTSA